MFLGVVPKECLQQIIKVMDVEAWTDVHVCCSGTFRMDRALVQANPALRVHSNDVSLFSCCMAGLAIGKPVTFKFKGELAFVEKLIKGGDAITRAGAVMVAFEMARYSRRNNEFNRRHFDYYQNRFVEYVDKVRPKIEATLAQMHLTSFFGGDWRDHAKAAIEMGSNIIAFPPFSKGGYEAQFRFIDENVKWNAPPYDLYDPGDLHEITQALDDVGGKFCILTDQVWEDREPVLKYSAGLRLPHYCYAEANRSSLVRKESRAAPFKYQPVELAELRPKTEIVVVQADSATLNFIKDVYLAKGIKHVSGALNYLVFADGKLVGSIIYDEGPVTRMAYGPRTINVLSDLSVTTDGKISKLVAMIAKSRSLVHAMELKLVKRYDRLVTTAFTRNPSSMKYRGVLKKLSRRENDAGNGYVIQYGGDLDTRHALAAIGALCACQTWLSGMAIRSRLTRR